MASRVGTSDEFNPSNDTVINYVKHAQIYLEANDIAEAKKVSTLLSTISKKTFAVLWDCRTTRRQDS